MNRRNYSIYSIEIKALQKIVYIGKSVNFQSRIRTHKSELRAGTHNFRLQNFYDIYGEGNFKFKEIYRGFWTPKESDEEEIKTIRKYNTFYLNNFFGANLTLGGMGIATPPRFKSVQKMVDTKKENKDSYTHTIGEINGQHKVTEKQVEEIVKLLWKGKTHKSIAEDFGLQRSAIGLIANGQRWSYLESVQEYSKYHLKTIKKRTTKEEVYQIRDLWKNKIYEKEELCELYQISKRALKAILRNQSYLDVDISKPISEYYDTEKKKRNTTREGEKHEKDYNLY